MKLFNLLACSYVPRKLTRPVRAAARAWYQNTLHLSANEAAQLKQNAAAGNRALAAQDLQAQQVAAAAHAQNIKNAPPELAQLELGRTAISNTCIQNLQSALGPATFRKIDVYVRTAVAKNASVARPPLVAPKSPLAGGGK